MFSVKFARYTKFLRKIFDTRTILFLLFKIKLLAGGPVTSGTRQTLVRFYTFLNWVAAPFRKSPFRYPVDFLVCGNHFIDLRCWIFQKVTFGAFMGGHKIKGNPCVTPWHALEIPEKPRHTIKNLVSHFFASDGAIDNLRRNPVVNVDRMQLSQSIPHRLAVTGVLELVSQYFGS